MSPKERRDRLLKKEKPYVRRMEILDGETYSSDMGVLWAAHKAGTFGLGELSQEDFVTLMEKELSVFEKVFVVDDNNKAYGKGRGPVALIGTNVSGLIVEPRPIFFKWATKKNILRASVSFLNMLKHSSKTGVCFVKAKKDKRTLPNHLKDYDMLYYVGKVSDSDYLYSIRGRGSD